VKTSPRTSVSLPSSTASKPAALLLLADYAAVMERLGLGWYVFGAQAAATYGRPRMTADVDITVDLGRMDTLAFVAALEGAGFVLRLDFDEGFLRESRLLPLVHRATAMPADVMIACTRLHTEFLARRKMVDLGGLRVPMLSPEDLVVTKVLAGRRKDLEDVRGVLVAQLGLDLGHVRELLGELEVALDEDGLLRRFERLANRTR
jgi:hypothetical protein